MKIPSILYTLIAGWRGEWERLAAGVEGTGFQVPSFVAELQISRDPETPPGPAICSKMFAL